MKKTLIIETSQINKTSIDAHVRNSIELTKIINADLISKKTDIPKVLNNNYSSIIVSYGSFYFDFEPFKRLIEKNKNAKLYWMTNEYNLSMNGSIYKLFRKKGYSALTNFVEKSFNHKHYQNYYCLNLNLLLFNDTIIKNSKKYNYIYYGTFRPDRKKYFKKYLKDEFYISTSKKNGVKFLLSGCEGKIIDKLKWSNNKSTLSLFRYSLYIEDEHTHNNYNHLANRFYEALSNECVIIFDINCLNTLKKSEISNYEKFLVKNYDDLLKFNETNYKENLEIKKNGW